ncbi:L-ascorbate oxidase [Elysia marginata]|uniref:L-ascorbate oxidase n=1 Tax=Elysia marginata TaxID=1093978 RepID=A0AAV4G286_9GAST|nr:L-ascorbate oxidase [Elysia marginata]
MVTGRLGYHVTTVSLALCVGFSVTWAERGQKNPYDIQDYRDHACVRSCQEGEKPMTCRYYFLVEHYTTLSAACYDCHKNRTDCLLPQCVPGAGLQRPVLTVNRMIPGPAIHEAVGECFQVLPGSDDKLAVA